MLRTYMMFYMSVPPPFAFCSPKGTIMKIRSISDLYYAIPATVKLLDTYIVFCKVVFILIYCTFLLWQINTYLLTYLGTTRRYEKRDVFFLMPHCVQKSLNCNCNCIVIPAFSFKGLKNTTTN